MRRQLVEATVAALKSISNKRLYKTERGFQGRFYCALQDELGRSILTEDLILEMEYQKSKRHGTRQRPDIILHIPVDISGGAVNANNYAVWALKRCANQSKAEEDFCKLNEMFRRMNYQNGFFINIDSKYHHLNDATHKCDLAFRDRLSAFAVQFNQQNVIVRVAYWQNDAIIEEEY